MKLVVTEKNIAAKNIAELLADTKAKADKVYATPVYRFTHEGEEWVTVGLKGHILAVDFSEGIVYREKENEWYAVDEGEVTGFAPIPDTLPKPPFQKRKPFTVDGVDLKAWKIAALPYLVYAPLRKTPAEKEIIRALGNLAGKADSIVIATDFDREGELIGSDALSVVRKANPTAPVARARYSAITKEEITHAFTHLVDLDVGLAQAGESRQQIDLVWGAVLTRYLTIAKFSGYGKVRPSGRVQTPTLALIVAKEAERNAFVPEDYWTIKGEFSAAGEKFTAMHATDRFKQEAVAQAALAATEGAREATVTSIEKKSRKVNPPVPFNTTALQAAAAAEGLSPARTMRIAETLYMNGYISYPRVDNTVYPASLDLADTAKTLAKNPAYAPYVSALLAKGKPKATRGKTETTDHPPIYPTGVASSDALKPEEWKLYNLVARRFLATLSDAAVIEGTKLTLDVAGQPFVAKGDVLVTPGFRAIYPYGLKKDEQLPLLDKGQVVDFLGAEMTHKQTEPPARYSQGRVIQEMEKCGLGTKSTRHTIIDRLYEVHYIQNDPIEPTALGIAVIDALGKFAPHITTPNMTAQLEDEMNSIAAGERDRDDVVMHSRALLAGIMDDLIPRKEEVGAALTDAVAADARIGTCPTCGSDLLLKSSPRTRSSFIGCSAWPDCDVTYPLPTGKIEAVDALCPVCGSPQIKVTPFRSKPQISCVDPACETNQEPDVEVGECPTCAAADRPGKLIAQRSQRSLKRFIRCTCYDECGVSFPLPSRGKLEAAAKQCPDCGIPMVIVQTGRGPWELCPNPECPGREKKEKAGGAKGRKQAASRKPSARSSSKGTTKGSSKGAAKGTSKGTQKAASKSASKSSSKGTAKGS